MILLFFLLIILFGAASLYHPVGEACGSQFLVGSRAARYQRMQRAANPSTILIYWRQDVNTPEEKRRDAEFKANLEKVGHKIEVATDPDAFQSAMGTGRFNIVMMNLQDARQMQAQVQSSSAVLLPLVAFATRPEYSQAKKEFGLALSRPTTMRKLLSAVEKAGK